MISLSKKFKHHSDGVWATSDCMQLHSYVVHIKSDSAGHLERISNGGVGGVGVWGSDLLGECSGYMVRILGQLWPYSAFCLIYSP